MKAIPGKISIDLLQKTAVHEISHIIQNVLKSETGTMSTGDHCWFKRSTRKKRPVTRDKNKNKNNNNNNNNNNNVIIIIIIIIIITITITTMTIVIV